LDLKKNQKMEFLRWFKKIFADLKGLNLFKVLIDKFYQLLEAGLKGFNLFKVYINKFFKKFINNFRDVLKFVKNYIKTFSNFNLFICECRLENFIYRFINKIKDFIYTFLFGKKPGTYFSNNPIHLAFPQIVLNDIVLLELQTFNNDKIQRFFWEMFRDFDYWDKEKLVSFEAKLMELLEGKSFPFESPFFKQTKSKPYEFSFPLGTSMDKMFYPTELSTDFTFNLYLEWKRNPEFLTFVICYYFGNYIIADDIFEIDFVSNVNL
jgi:hypothetical protein